MFGLDNLIDAIFASATEQLSRNERVIKLLETIRLWDVRTGASLKVLRNTLYEGMNITRIKGLTEVEKINLKALGGVEDQ